MTGFESPYRFSVGADAPRMASLLVGLRYVRQTTVETVEGLSVSDLAHVHDEGSNSIGALLLHIGVVEWVYQVLTFDEREPTKEDVATSGIGLDLGPSVNEISAGWTLERHLDRLDRIRQRTLRELGERDDAWLARSAAAWRGKASDAHFYWFHVLEDELNHRGQIRWLRKRLPSAGNGDVA